MWYFTTGLILLKHHMKILFGEFKAKLEKEGIFNRQLGMRFYRRIAMKVALWRYSTTLVHIKIHVVKNTMFPYPNFPKYTCSSSEGKSRNWLITYWCIGDCMYVHSVHDISMELTVILFTPTGDCKYQGKLLVTKQHKRLMWKDLMSSSNASCNLGNSTELWFRRYREQSH